MKKYICSICGYIYDEQKEGVAFDSLPQSWACPLCGAPKSAFRLQEDPVGEAQNAQKGEAQNSKKGEAQNSQKGEAQSSKKGEAQNASSNKGSAGRELSNAERSVLCTNLAKGCEKQYKTEEMNLFLEIADFYKKRSEGATERGAEKLSQYLQGDLKECFPAGFEVAKADGDRGALRVLTWSEKVSKIVASLLSRYLAEGTTFLQNTKIFVCEICGFVYLGEEAPEICPICKVPQFKIHEVREI